ncbi:hypothetical protein GPL15_17170 [Clostridium sp. MCC353]|uniref:fibronectin type III domain-containing protein n=1 Tax=Clostridium sp. MCC353 TaxID=2592646 RepID=UPI001C02DF84|nr:fibronectin type III domain-containing protein [Clostridium sp. MCC353]MBT9778232.1 hypothetical protein [Clostridium sp. MCC353]
MKKAAIFTLALSLCFQTPLSVLNADAKQTGRYLHTEHEEYQIATTSNAEHLESVTEDRDEEVLTASGSNGLYAEGMGGYRGAVQVEIHSVLMTEKTANFEVNLTAAERKLDGYEEEHEVLIDWDSEENDSYGSETAVFTNLIPGRYRLEVTGDGYESYEQYINVKESTYKVMLMNDYLPGYTFKSGTKHPGILKPGDVNEDGTIDSEDLEELLEAIHGRDRKFSRSELECYDINGDGEVDLTDLQYFTIFYKNTAHSTASVTEITTVRPDDIKVASDSNADPSEIPNLFDGDSATYLTLEPIEEGEVGEENPIVLELDMNRELKAEGIAISALRGSGIESGTIEVTYEDENGKLHTVPLDIPEEVQDKEMLRSGVGVYRSAGARIERDADGTLVLDLGRQVAIKKISIVVTKTSQKNLVEISKVEFLNDMESRIPAPVMNIPTELTAKAGSKSFVLTWKKEPNVTGYEVRIEYEGKKQIIKTKENKLEVKSFNNDKLKNGQPYSVSVQSVNGDWRSGYSASITVIPVTDQRPDPPENVVIKSGYRSLNISWKDMEDTDTYSLFYRVYSDANGAFECVEGIAQNNAVLNGLEDETEYEVYLTGQNEIGESGPSAHYRGTTSTLNPPVTPNYKLINVVQEGQAATYNIVNVEGFGTDEELPFAMVDGDYSTGWVRNDWDAGVAYPANGMGKSPIITFDQIYEMDTIAAIPDDAQPYEFYDASVYCWTDLDGKPVKVPGKLSKKTSSNKKTYYEFQCENPISPQKIQVNFRTYNSGRIGVAELKFYYYDSLEDEIFGLYEDDMHMALKADADQAAIDRLRERLHTPDDVSGELHPKKDMLEKELDNAQKLLDDLGVKGIVKIHNDVTKKADGAITFKSGLNAWQPIGISANAGETIVVYVGAPGKKTGDSTELKLIATQYHGEDSWSKELGSLKAGANEITIPDLTSLDAEHGGSLYVEYTGAKGKGDYSVRVSGGNSVPVLDITTATSSDAQKDLVTEYVKELEEYVPRIAALHDEKHGIETSYEANNCTLGATDLVMKNMMFSVSSQQILSALSGSTEEKSEQLYQSLKAMEEMVDLFYHHKGLSDEPEAGAQNRLPSSRLNIRYQRMPAGVFMYAGGGHIGIEWGSVPGLAKAVPVQADENGRYQTGRYMGWGIAHEIGHEINESTYAIAEITNNYFSVLAQAKDTNDSVRFKYKDVYDKVTSGVVGRSSNVFTQLGLYWQLHLAYDRGGYNYKMYQTYEEQFNNLFFARVDTYSRDPSLAPKPGDVALEVQGDTDNKLMRLACAAAEKNILEFFTRWGMVPDEGTRKYAAQFEDETRAIWFVNDEARVYAMEHGKDGSIAQEMTVKAALSYQKGTNAVTISLDNDAAKKDAVLGYEIYRTEYVKGEKISNPVGFVTADQDTFTDYITTVNNRVFTYEVVGYDKYLNRTSKAAVMEPVKVSHNGNMDKASWTVTTNMVSQEDKQEDSDADYETGNGNPCEIVKRAVEKVIDGDPGTVYTGSFTSNNAKENPEIIINLNQVETISGFSYTPGDAGTPIRKYGIFTSLDGVNWTEVKTGTFDEGTETQTVYFSKEGDSWMYAFDASYVKLAAIGQKGVELSVAELDVLGRNGDNVELFEDGIGILKEDFDAGTDSAGTEQIIPKGSFIFTGSYRGNPAYNAVLLFDENGDIVGGSDENGYVKAAQMIFAEVPEHGELGETSDGTWVYYIEPEDLERMQMPSYVRAELSRVDNAHTNKGERLVSDTVFIPIPEVLPEITIRPSAGAANIQ